MRPARRGTRVNIVEAVVDVRGSWVAGSQEDSPETFEVHSPYDGSLVARETVVDGLDSAVEAFQALLSGGNTGKMVVRLAPDPV